jgi:hypothetical protein
LQKHWPPEQVPQQQSSALVHLSVALCDTGKAQPQNPLSQKLVQQSLGREQAPPRGWQAHTCGPPPVGGQSLLQQVVPELQPPPLAVQVLQVPLSQRPLQQSPSALQLPLGLH